MFILKQQAPIRPARLIVFFHGWGLSPEHFSHMSHPSVDLLHIYDYRNFDNVEIAKIEETMHFYNEVTLIAYSLGVFMASTISKTCFNRCKQTIALNGTPIPISDEFGIPCARFEKTLRTLSEKNITQFFQNMMPEKPIFPTRRVADLKEELLYLKEYIKRVSRFKENRFDVALVSEKDLIFPPKNQRNFFSNRYFSLYGGHFPFFQFSSWEDLIDKTRDSEVRPPHAI